MGLKSNGCIEMLQPSLYTYRKGRYYNMLHAIRFALSYNKSPNVYLTGTQYFLVMSIKVHKKLAK
jgi:hypothetical protein